MASDQHDEGSGVTPEQYQANYNAQQQQQAQYQQQQQQQQQQQGQFQQPAHQQQAQYPQQPPHPQQHPLAAPQQPQYQQPPPAAPQQPRQQQQPPPKGILPRAPKNAYGKQFGQDMFGVGKTIFFDSTWGLGNKIYNSVSELVKEPFKATYEILATRLGYDILLFLPHILANLIPPNPRELGKAVFNLVAAPFRILFAIGKLLWTVAKTPFVIAKDVLQTVGDVLYNGVGKFFLSIGKFLASAFKSAIGRESLVSNQQNIQMQAMGQQPSVPGQQSPTATSNFNHSPHQAQSLAQTGAAQPPGMPPGATPSAAAAPGNPQGGPNSSLNYIPAGAPAPTPSSSSLPDNDLFASATATYPQGGVPQAGAAAGSEPYGDPTNGSSLNSIPGAAENGLPQQPNHYQQPGVPPQQQNPQQQPHHPQAGAPQQQHQLQPQAPAQHQQQQHQAAPSPAQQQQQQHQNPHQQQHQQQNPSHYSEPGAPAQQQHQQAPQQSEASPPRSILKPQGVTAETTSSSNESGKKVHFAGGKEATSSTTGASPPSLDLSNQPQQPNSGPRYGRNMLPSSSAASAFTSAPARLHAGQQPHGPVYAQPGAPSSGLPAGTALSYQQSPANSPVHGTSLTATVASAVENTSFSPNRLGP